MFCLFVFVTIIFFVYLAFNVVETNQKLAFIFAFVSIYIIIEKEVISSFNFNFNFSSSFDSFIFTCLNRLLNQ